MSFPSESHTNMSSGYKSNQIPNHVPVTRTYKWGWLSIEKFQATYIAALLQLTKLCKSRHLCLHGEPTKCMLFKHSVACQILINKSDNSVTNWPAYRPKTILCGLITWSNCHAVKPVFFPSVPQMGLCICHLWMSERMTKVTTNSTIFHAVKKRQSWVLIIIFRKGRGGMMGTRVFTSSNWDFML